MNIQKVLRELREEYLGKDIFQNKDENGSVIEVICEIEPSSEHPDYSVAIAVVDTIDAHVHHVSIETYEILRGQLVLQKDGEEHILEKGDTIEIRPKEVHGGIGEEVWIKVTSKPGWTLEDHILV